MLSAPTWAAVLVCCALPAGWMLANAAMHPRQLLAAVSTYRLELLGRTLLYGAGAALAAVMLAVPAALAIVRHRGAGVLVWFVPLTLIYPPIAYTYGWSHVFMLAGLHPSPGGAWDVLRCVWTLGAWLWPLPAMGLGFALQRLDAETLQQAVLDGALWRITGRLAAGPLAACFAATMVLASQEYTVYEPSGISVVATEVRTAFDTGVSAAAATDRRLGMPQADRCAAAATAGMPLAIVTAVLAVAALRGMRGTCGGSGGDAGRVMQPGMWATALSWIVLSVTLVLPTAAMIACLNGAGEVITFLRGAAGHVAGSLLHAAAAGACAAVAGLGAMIRKSGAALLISLAAFMAGGQMLAIADIHLYNRRAILGMPAGWIYAGLPMAVMAYLGRFLWLTLLAAQASWSREMTELREMAAIDGAGPLRTATLVVLPLFWPLLCGTAMLVAILSLTEVPATAILVPLNPPVMTNLLLTWVHQLKDGPMLAGSLVLLTITALAAGAAVLLMRVAVRQMAAPAMRAG